MTQQLRGGFTSLVWLATVVGGCSGWVDLESPKSNGESGSGSMAVGGTSALPGGVAGTGSEIGRGGDARPGSRVDAGAGGAPLGEGGASTEPGHGPLLVLQPPSPTLLPDGAQAPGVTWVGTSSITGGSLEDGALVGTNAYCFRLTPSSPQCEWDSEEPFVWTEATGMVVLDRLDRLGADARYFYPHFVSVDGDVVVGTFSLASGLARTWGGYFRWTKTGGATTLGEPPGTESGGPEFMSDDGSVVSGMAKVSKPAELDHAEFLWTVPGGFQPLAATTTWPDTAEIKAMSADGSLLVGQTHSEPVRLFRWTQQDGAEPLGSLPGLPNCDFNRITRDAEVVFGNCTAPQDYEHPGTSFRWTKPTGMQPLMKAGSSEACAMYPRGLSDDGLIAFGYARCGESPTFELARWGQEGVTLLPTSPIGKAELLGASASRDGSVAFGVLSQSPEPAQLEGLNGDQAFRWSAADGLVALGMLAGHQLSSAYAADAPGDVLVGRSGIEHGASEAVLWDSIGLLSIAAYLQGQGIDLQGAHLKTAERVATHDDVTIVQGVSDLQNRTGAWIAWIPRRP
jgi:uncharacterized membrane protein